MPSKQRGPRRAGEAGAAGGDARGRDGEGEDLWALEALESLMLDELLSHTQKALQRCQQLSTSPELDVKELYAVVFHSAIDFLTSVMRTALSNVLP